MDDQLAAEVRNLLHAITHGGTYEPNEACENEVCQILGRLQTLVDRQPATTNGKRVRAR